MILFLSVLITAGHLYYNYIIKGMMDILLYSNMNIYFKVYYFVGYHIAELIALTIILNSIKNFYIVYFQKEDREEKGRIKDINDTKGKVKLKPFPWFDNMYKDKFNLIIGEKHSWEGYPLKNPEYYQLPEKGLHGSMVVFGSTGAGKTSAFANPFLTQAISYQHNNYRKKMGGLLLDVKGDFIHYVLEQAIRFNREQDIIEVKVEKTKKDYEDIEIMQSQLKILKKIKNKNLNEEKEKAKKILLENEKKRKQLEENIINMENKLNNTIEEDPALSKKIKDTQKQLKETIKKLKIYLIFKDLKNRSELSRVEETNIYYNKYYYKKSVNINYNDINKIIKLLKYRINKKQKINRLNPLYAPNLTPASQSGLIKQMIMNYRGTSESKDAFFDLSSEELVRFMIKSLRYTMKHDYYTFTDLIYFISNSREMLKILLIHLIILSKMINKSIDINKYIIFLEDQEDQEEDPEEKINISMVKSKIETLDKKITSINIEIENTNDKKKIKELEKDMEELIHEKQQYKNQKNKYEKKYLKYLKEGKLNEILNREETVYNYVRKKEEIEKRYKSIKNKDLNIIYDDIESIISWIINEWLSYEGEKVQLLIQKNYGIVINLFNDPSIKKIFCPRYHELDFHGYIESVINQGKIIVSNIPKEKYTSQSILINTFMKIQFQKEVNQRVPLSETDPNININRNIFFMIDEAKDYISQGDGEYCSLSRQSKAINVYLTQMYSQFIHKLGNKTAGQVLKGNLRNLITLNTEDKETAQLSSELAGKRKVVKRRKTRTESSRDSKYEVSTGDIKADDKTISESESIDIKRENYFDPDVFYRLSLNQAFIKGFDGNKVLKPRIIYTFPHYNPVWKMSPEEAKNNPEKIPSWFDWYDVENPHLVKEYENDINI